MVALDMVDFEGEQKEQRSAAEPQALTSWTTTSLGPLEKLHKEGDIAFDKIESLIATAKAPMPPFVSWHVVKTRRKEAMTLSQQIKDSVHRWPKGHTAGFTVSSRS